MNHPRIFRDFNDRLDRTTYGLRARGTRDDLARLPEPIAPGTRLTLYDDDAVEDGKPAWIVAEGVVVTLSSGDVPAQVDPGSLRWEPREA